jgi:hypothetical protein
MLIKTHVPISYTIHLKFLDNQNYKILKDMQNQIN